jgi:hypothetical protein
MATRQELLQEAYRRGLMPEKQRIVYEEGITRGIIPSQAAIPEEEETPTTISEPTYRTSYERALAEAETPVQKGLIGITGGLERAAYGLAQPFLPEKAQERLGEVIASQKEAEAKAGLPAKVGGFVGEIAPYVAAPAPGIPALAAESAAVSYFAPREEVIPQTQRLKEAAAGGAVGAGTGAILKGVTKVPKGFKRLFNVDSDALQAFEKAEIKPSLGEVSESGNIKRIQSFLGKVPGSSGVLEKSREQTVKNISDILEKTKKVEPVSSQVMGDILQKESINYSSRFKNISSKLYDRLDKYLPKKEPININNTQNLLQRQIQEFKESPELQGTILKSEGGKWLIKIAKDAAKNEGKLPYSSIKKYRSYIGDALGDKFTIGDADRILLKQIYESLSNDIKSTIDTKGYKAISDFNKANKFYKEGITKIEDNLQSLINKNRPEEAYTYAISGTKEGSTRLKNIMSSISSESKDILRATTIQRMGLHNNEFLPTKFFREYNKMSPEAKNTLFKASQKTSLDNLNKVIGRISKVDAAGNFSNTTPHAVLGLLGFGVLAGATAPIKALGGSYLTSKLFTSPKFINWLAEATVKKSPGALSKHIDKLGIIAAKDIDIRNEILDYLDNLNKVNREEEE